MSYEMTDDITDATDLSHEIGSKKKYIGGGKTTFWKIRSFWDFNS